MVEKSRPQVIALEEHYWDRELVDTFQHGDRLRVPAAGGAPRTTSARCASRKWTRPASTFR